MSATILDEIVDHAVREHCQRRISETEENSDNMESEMNNNYIVTPEENKSDTRSEKAKDPWKIREKLKSMPALKRDHQERKSRGPMVAKPLVAPVSTGTPVVSTSSSQSSSCASSSSSRPVSPVYSARGPRAPSPSTPLQRGARTPSPSSNEFQRHVVSRPRSPSFTYRNQSGRSSSGRRTPSPGGGACDHAPSEAEASKRVERALRARLYLLQQTGPNCFLIGGDSPSHKFKVIIGPQTCSCARGSHCIHLLFIMLRVLQVPRTDASLWAKTLKNYEVESLLQAFHKRRSKKRPPGDVTDSRPSAVSCGSSTESLNSQNSAREEEVCPICLLEMIDGESLVQCEGCRNKLHHHCISVWFEECRLQRERLNCPLCRGEWSIQQLDDSDAQAESAEPPREDTESPDPANHELPYCDVIPDEALVKVRPWIEVFGEDLVACIFSRDWSSREKCMAHFRKRCAKYLEAEREENGQTNWSLVGVGCDVLNHVCSDPVYKVFVGALKGLRCLLAHSSCADRDEVKTLETSLVRLIDNLLVKCADSNRRTSQLALSTLEELCKGQSGELAVGKKISTIASLGVDSLSLITARILQSYPPNSVHWQWLLGRFVAMDRVLDLHGNKLLSKGILMQVAELSVKELNNAHINIGRQARKVFITCARLAAHKNDFFKKLDDILDTADKVVQGRMRRRLSKVASEFSVAQRAASFIQPEPAYDTKIQDRQTSPTPPFPTPETSPRTPEQFHYGSEEGALEEPAGAREGRPEWTRLTSEESEAPGSPPDVSFRTEVTSPKRQPRVARFASACCRCEDSGEESQRKMSTHTLLRRLAANLLDTGQTCDDEYREGRDWVKGPVLGTGAFSTCYQVRDINTGTIMALKQITYFPNSDSDQEKAVKAIKSELSLTLKLNHQNVVRILGATQEENRFNMFVEWMPGGSVSGLLREFGAFSEPVTRNYTRQVLCGLAYLHDNKIVHRDLKGANLLVSSTGHQVRIADFGASARLASRSTGAGEFKGQLLGTVAFMAPEVLRGESYGRSCDIWSVGCVVIEMLTCKAPWGADDLSNHLALIYKIASSSRPPPIPSHTSPFLRQFLDLCFQQDSALRPSAQTLLAHDVINDDCDVTSADSDVISVSVTNSIETLRCE